MSCPCITDLKLQILAQFRNLWRLNVCVESNLGAWGSNVDDSNYYEDGDANEPSSDENYYSDDTSESSNHSGSSKSSCPFNEETEEEALAKAIALNLQSSKLGVPFEQYVISFYHDEYSVGQELSFRRGVDVSFTWVECVWIGTSMGPLGSQVDQFLPNSRSKMLGL
jgi:hypothetical protein